MTRTNLPALQKLILIFLADRHDTRNDECVFSHDRLASEAGLSTRATRYQLVKLEERGLIRKLPQIVAGKGQTYNDYRLNIAGLPSWANKKKRPTEASR
jgi:predicted ArsR family transcriptional regulator